MEIYFTEPLISFIYVITLVGFFIFLRLFLLKLAKSLFRKRFQNLKEVLLKSIETPSLIWSIIAGIYIGISFAEIPDKYLFYLNKFFVLTIIFSFTLFIANVIKNGLQFHISKFNLSIPATSLITSILYIMVFTTGFLLMLTIIGVSITPIITTLGIGGLAIALALKDTLSNIFAGLHILVEKSIRVGDFVRLESGQEGYLEDLTWRTARIKTLSNNMVIIPNNKLSQSIIINYSYPEKRMSIQIPVSVSLNSNFEVVESALYDVVNKAIPEVQGLLDNPQPIIRFTPNFTQGSYDFTIICTIEEFKYQNAILHELRKRILKRLKEEEIELPFYYRKFD